MSPSGAIASAEITGPIEQSYRERSAAFRAASNSTRLSRTHWHIAIANGLGWGFDGMDGVIFALATPLVIKDFGVTLPEYRSGLQIALLVGILGMYVWPWLADRYGRRTLLAVNIALFSLLMPIAALTTTFAAFVAVRSAINFALNGEWSLGSMLVAETWPAHMRGRVIGINRGTWCFGAALAGAIATFIIAEWGWRIACVVPAVVALLAVYVRMGLPESPYWVRLQDRKRRVREAQAAGRPLLSADQAWLDKAAKIPVRQLFLPDMLGNTAAATFIACCSTIIYGTVGGWMPLYLAQERHWSTATYGTFYIWWGLIGFLGLFAAGLISDRFGRKPAFYVMLAGRCGLPHPLGIRRKQHGAVDLRIAVEHRLPRILGAEHDPDGRDLSDAHPRRRQRLLLGRRMAGRLRAVAVRHYRHPAEYGFVRQGVPDRAGRDAADGCRYMAVHTRAQRQGAGRNRGLTRVMVV